MRKSIKGVRERKKLLDGEYVELYGAQRQSLSRRLKL